MPPPNAAIDPTSHRTVRYFPHSTPFRSSKNLIFLFCLITKIIAPNYNFTHYPNKLVDIYTSNRTLDLSPIPFGTIGASILFPQVPLPGFPTATCKDQQCRFEPVADRNLAEKSRQELRRRWRAMVVGLGRRVGEWYQESPFAGVFSSHKNLSHQLDEIRLLNSSTTMTTLTSTCELAREAYWTYRADHPISADGSWIHWLSGRLNDLLHHIPCPYLDYAFIGIVLRDILAFLASAGYIATIGFVSLLVVACRRYLSPYNTLLRASSQAGHRIPFLGLIPQSWALLFTACRLILLSAAYVLLSAHPLFTTIFRIPPALSDVPLSWFGYHHYRRYSSTPFPVLLCGTLSWLGFLATWRILAPFSGLLFSAILELGKYSYFFQQTTRKLRYYRGAYTRASRMAGPYVSYLALQALVDFTMIPTYFMVGAWIRDEFWDFVVPNWVKYSPTIAILAGYLWIGHALSGRHPSAQWEFRGLGRSEVVSVRVATLPGRLYEGWVGGNSIGEGEDTI